MNDVKQYPVWQKQIREAQQTDLQCRQVTEQLNESVETSLQSEKSKFLKSILSNVGIEADPDKGTCIIGQYKFVLSDNRKSYYIRPGIFIWVQRADLPDDEGDESNLHPAIRSIEISDGLWYDENKVKWEQVKLEMAKAFDELDEDAPSYLARWEARRIASLPYPEWQNKARAAWAKEQQSKNLIEAARAVKEREQDLPLMKKLMSRAGLEIEPTADHRFEKDGYRFSLLMNRDGCQFVITHTDLASPYHPNYYDQSRVIGLDKEYISSDETEFDAYFAADVASVFRWIDERRKYIAEAKKRAENGISKSDQLVALLKELLHSEYED